MSRDSSEDWSLTEGIVKKQKRFRYTPLEERKMWHFFAHELRGGNPKAKFGPAIWEQYRHFNKETTKSTYGLESHFRKIMIPNLLKYHAEMEKEDFFLLLRYFKIELNGEQLRRLERIFHCRLETDSNGCFLSACSLKPGDMSIYPSRQDRRTLCGLGDADMEVDEEQSSVVDEDAPVENIVIDDEKEEDGEADFHAFKTHKIAEAVRGVFKSKKGLENRKEQTRRNDASTSTTGGWLAKPKTNLVPHFQEVGIQCDNPCTQLSPPNSNVTIRPRPLTRSQTSKRSKSSSQTTAVSNCEIVRTTEFSYPSFEATGTTRKSALISKKIDTSPIRTRSQRRVSNELGNVTSPTYSLDSSNASSLILPTNSMQFVQAKKLKKKLLANVANIVDHGAGAVNRFMDGVPQNRRDNWQLAQKQLEWILRDDLLRTTSLRRKRTVST